MNIAEFNSKIDRYLAEGDFKSAEALLFRNSEMLPPEKRSKPFSAPVRLKVEGLETGEEGDIAVPLANKISRMIRNAKYRSKIAKGYKGIKIIEEGDSWHQYPVILSDIIDVISNEYAVFSLASAGDTVESIAMAGEFIDAIAKEKPHVFLLSAGGNDLLGEGRLKSVLKEFTNGAKPESLINKLALDKIVAVAASHYRSIVNRSLSVKPNLRIFLHGYDYPHPVAGGRSLGKPLAEKGIPLPVGREVIRTILDSFNEELATIAAEKSANVTYVDLRGKVDEGAASWHDEIHPKNKGFARAAKLIEAHLSKIKPLQKESLSVEGLEEAHIEATGIAAQSKSNAQNRLRYRPGQKIPDSDYQRRIASDPQVQQAWRDFKVLSDESSEPESDELIKAREEYSLYFSRPHLEQIIGENNLDEYFVLSRGTLVGRAVARLFVRNPGAGGAYGTGFLVAPNLLLTNNHVIPDSTHAVNTVASFDYEFDTNGDLRKAHTFRMTDEVFFTSADLDYSFVSVEANSEDGTPLADFGFVPLLPKSGKVLKNEFVNIIQHPGGDLKKVALRENKVMGRRGDFLYYETDTLPGSSGSPVFNEEWQIAALHHMAVPDPQVQKKYIANRGVRVSSILQDVTGRRATGDKNAAEVDRLLQEGRLRAGNGITEAKPQIHRDNFSRVDETAQENEDDFSEVIDAEGELVLPVQDGKLETAGMLAAKWPSNPANAPDTWHLPVAHADDVFELTGDVIEGLIAVGDYQPHTGTNGKLIISLRGCQHADGSASKEDKMSIRLMPVNPDHENFRCLVGVYDTATRRISLYLGSTVPRRTGMLKYYNKINFGTGVNCNMLPTGCYEHCVGTHGGSAGPVSYVLRLGNGPTPAMAGRATVLRTSNDLTYGTMDVWDNTIPADNIHPAFLSSSFSSLGCLTVRGKQSANSSHMTGTGEWRMFRKKAGFDGSNHAKRFDNLLVTGLEAAAVAAALLNGSELTPLICLRHGSVGDRVRNLQLQLGLNQDGEFGAGTRKDLARLQYDRLGFATGSWTPKMAESLGLLF